MGKFKDILLTAIITANIFIAVFFLFGSSKAEAKYDVPKQMFVRHRTAEYCVKDIPSPLKEKSIEGQKKFIEMIERGTVKVVSMSCPTECLCYMIAEL